MSTKISIETDGTTRDFYLQTREAFAEVTEVIDNESVLVGWVSSYGNRNTGRSYRAVKFIDVNTPNVLLGEWAKRKEAVADLAAYSA